MHTTYINVSMQRSLLNGQHTRSLGGREGPFLRQRQACTNGVQCFSRLTGSNLRKDDARSRQSISCNAAQLVGVQELVFKLIWTFAAKTPLDNGIAF